jgi:O-antigen/teichoic acid export membrane protein
VRILDVAAYGQYQEFMIYATLFVAISTFAIDSSLTYFLPKHEMHQTTVVSQTSILIFVASSLCLAILILARPAFSAITSYDFVLPLVAYVFCFVNLGWIEYYWIATKRTDLVMYYSAARLLLRVSVLLIVAYVTRDVWTIIWSVVAVEAIRLVLVAGYLLKNRLLTLHLRWALITAQLRFALPLGVANVSGLINKNIGKLFIGTMMGPTALAYYAIGGYLMPAIKIFRQSIGDVVFPELVRGQNDPARALSLWQRTNVMYCVLLFPAFVFLFFYAEVIVTTLFTPAFIEAVPVFQVYLLFLLRRCFNLDVLLRSRGRTAFILYGGLLTLGVNVALMLFFHRAIGFLGPAVAYIVTSTVMTQ